MSTDIRELLDVAADDSGRSTIDADALVARGRRKVRTRRAGAAVCAAAVLVAAVVGVSQLPTLRSDAPVPPAATPTQTAGTEEAAPAGVFKPLPGVRPGDAALASVSMSEALRRCQLKWSAEVGHDVGGLEFLSGQPIEGSVPPMFRPGDVLLVDSDVKAPGYTCVIPGDSQPGKDQLAEVDKTSIASDDRSVLRRCSSTLWHDLTGWKLLSKRVEPGALGAAVAVSPSGKFVARCFLGGPNAIKAVVEWVDDHHAATGASLGERTLRLRRSRLRRRFPDLRGRRRDVCRVAVPLDPPGAAERGQAQDRVQRSQHRGRREAGLVRDRLGRR